MPPKSINIGHLSTAYHTSFILMGTGWLRKRLKVSPTWQLFASGPDIVRAMDKGSIDIGYIGLPPAIIGMDRGIDIKCVAGGHVEGTVMIARDAPGLKETGSIDLESVLRRFEGKIIGSPPAGSIHDVIIRNMLKENGLASRIEVKNYAWTDFVLEAMVDREIDAAVGTPSLAVAAGIACGAVIVIPPDKLWPDNPSYGILVHSRLIEEQRDMVEGFLQLHEEACNLIRTRPEKAARIVSKTVGIMDEDFVRKVYAVSPKYCAALPESYINSTMKFVPVLHRLKYISKMLSVNEIFDTSIIDRIHPEAAHY